MHFQTAGSLCVYTLASIYVNLTNSYEKPKIDEELVKLAQVFIPSFILFFVFDV